MDAVYRGEFCQDRDLLQINMESISKELNDLIVTADQETFRCQTVQMPDLQQPIFPVACNESMPMPINAHTYNVYYKQEQTTVPTGFQHMHVNQFHRMPPGYQTIFPGNMVHTARPTYFNAPGALYPTLGIEMGSKNMTTPNANLSVTETPEQKREIHYLKRKNVSSGMQATPLISISTQRYDGNCGCFNKQKLYRKSSRAQKHHNSKLSIQTPDYSKIEVDFNKLGLFSDGKERNQVLRLFRLFRDLHVAISEVELSPTVFADSEFEDTFTPSPPIAMRATMNVLHQVKQAHHKLYDFITVMQKKLNENKIFDHFLYKENMRHLNKLRSLFEQLEKYKSRELEHKLGRFFDEDIIVVVDNLELLLQAINKKIREIHLRVASYEWYIGVKYRSPQSGKAIMDKTEAEDEKQSKILSI
uniref:Uncharacterized protein n=1 Tax=Glossina brevipalpis TaxID=37001 RepID=A0A1A9WGV5_9MUSC